jgi:hypothetical protein
MGNGDRTDSHDVNRLGYAGLLIRYANLTPEKQSNYTRCCGFIAKNGVRQPHYLGDVDVRFPKLPIQKPDSKEVSDDYT